jgi:hypothetical protein
MKKYKLSEVEKATLTILAALRHSGAALQDHKTLSNVAPYMLDMNFTGLVGEYAYAKRFNLFFDPVPQVVKDVSELSEVDLRAKSGLTIDVKTTTKEGQGLIINEYKLRRKKKVDIYALCYYSRKESTAHLLGYIESKAAHDRPTKQLYGKPVVEIPIGDLKSL